MRCMPAIYARALEQPGVVVLHDAVLHHFLLGQLDETRYVDEFVFNYGEWNRGLALGTCGAAVPPPAPIAATSITRCCRRIAERSRASSSTTRRRRASCGNTRPRARVEEIPHLFAPPPLPSEAEVIRYRQRIGVGPSDFSSAFSDTCGNRSG